MCSVRLFLGRPSHILLESRKRDYFLGGGGVADTELCENVKIEGRLSQSQKKIIGQIGGSLIVNVRAIDNDMFLDWSRINQIFSVVLKW